MSLLKFRILFVIQFVFAVSAFSQLNENAYLDEAKTDLGNRNYFDAIQKLDVCLKVRPGDFVAYFFRGVCKYYLNDNAGAELDLTNAISFYNPYLSDAYHYRSIVKYRLGDFDGAIEDINQVIDQHKNDPTLYVERAFSELSTGNSNKAISDCNKALSLNWSSTNLYLCRGMAESTLHKFDTALIDFNKALQMDPKNIDAYIRIGMTYAGMEKYKEALEQYDKALKMDSACTLAYFNRAEADEKLNDDKAALEDLNMVIHYDPMNALAYFNRGIMEGGKYQYSEAIADFDKVLNLNPENIEALSNRANLKAIVKDYQGAIDDYSKLIELFPYFIEAYYNRGHIKEILNDNAGAKADYNLGKIMSRVSYSMNNSQRANDSVTLMHLSALNSNFNTVDRKLADSISVDLVPIYYIILKDNNSGKPGYFPVLLKKMNKEYRGFSLTNQQTEAQSYMADSSGSIQIKAIGDSSNKAEGHLQNAIEKTNMQLFIDAIKEYNKIIAQDTGNAIAYFARGVDLCKEVEMRSRFNEDRQYLQVNKKYGAVKDERDEKYERALEDFNKVIKLEPDFAFAYYDRAFIKYKFNDSQGAIEDYTNAIENDPDLADAYYNRGLLLFLTNDKEDACKDFSKAGELGKNEAYSIIKLYCR